MRLTMVGTGYVGLVTGTCLANKGNHVTCLDIDADKINQLKAGRVPIYEPGLEELIEHNVRAGRLDFTTDKTAAYRSAEAIFICVGTPSDDRGHADLSAVIAVARDIALALEAATGATGGESDDDPEKIVIVKSTVPVGTNAKVQTEIAANTAKLFHMASNPEFLKEGAAINDFNKPDRVVIGAASEYAGERLRDLYAPFVRQGNPIYVMDIPSAEMVKYAANCMLATKISFINEIAALCESFGADIDQVRLGMCADNRIGNKFLYPGLGYGGSCFPKDVLACISMGQETDTPARVLEAVDDVNNRQRQRFLAKIDNHFNRDLSGKRIAIWGLAFKPGTDDMRQAPSVTIIQHLLDNGADVVAYDPVAEHSAREVFDDHINYVGDPISATENADALVICTDWDEFKNPDLPAVRKNMKSPVIFDGRNLHGLDAMRRAGFTYHSVGRAVVKP